MDRKYLQVDGHDDLVRDTESNAIVNRNKGAYLLAKVQKQKEEIEKQKQEIAEQRKQIQEMIDG